MLLWCCKLLLRRMVQLGPQLITASLAIYLQSTASKLRRAHWAPTCAKNQSFSQALSKIQKRARRTISSENERIEEKSSLLDEERQGGGL